MKAALSELVESNGYDDQEVIYSYEAWEVVAGNEFNDYAEDCDLSDVTTAIEAVNRQANETIFNACYSLVGDITTEIAEQIMLLVETANEEGYEGDIKISNGSVHGWAVHTMESDFGVCYYENLEGEKGLSALELNIGGSVYASVCWNK